jgi:hypothetical protein
VSLVFLFYHALLPETTSKSTIALVKLLITGKQGECEGKKQKERKKTEGKLN